VEVTEQKREVSMEDYTVCIQLQFQSLMQEKPERLQAEKNLTLALREKFESIEFLEECILQWTAHVTGQHLQKCSISLSAPELFRIVPRYPISHFVTKMISHVSSSFFCQPDIWNLREALPQKKIQKLAIRKRCIEQGFFTTIAECVPWTIIHRLKSHTSIAPLVPLVPLVSQNSQGLQGGQGSSPVQMVPHRNPPPPQYQQSIPPPIPTPIPTPPPWGPSYSHPSLEQEQQLQKLQMKLQLLEDNIQTNREREKERERERERDREMDREKQRQWEYQREEWKKRELEMQQLQQLQQVQQVQQVPSAQSTQSTPSGQSVKHTQGKQTELKQIKSKNKEKEELKLLLQPLSQDDANVANDDDEEEEEEEVEDMDDLMEYTQDTVPLSMEYKDEKGQGTVTAGAPAHTTSNELFKTLEEEERVFHSRTLGEDQNFSSQKNETNSTS
jgi:hypothetical protein